MFVCVFMCHGHVNTTLTKTKNKHVWSPASIFFLSFLRTAMTKKTELFKEFYHPIAVWHIFQCSCPKAKNKTKNQPSVCLNFLMFFLCALYESSAAHAPCIQACVSLHLVRLLAGMASPLLHQVNNLRYTYRASKSCSIPNAALAMAMLMPSFIPTPAAGSASIIVWLMSTWRSSLAVPLICTDFENCTVVYLLVRLLYSRLKCRGTTRKQLDSLNDAKITHTLARVWANLIKMASGILALAGVFVAAWTHNICALRVRSRRIGLWLPIKKPEPCPAGRPGWSVSVFLNTSAKSPKRPMAKLWFFLQALSQRWEI